MQLQSSITSTKQLSRARALLTLKRQSPGSGQQQLVPVLPSCPRPFRYLHVPVLAALLLVSHSHGYSQKCAAPAYGEEPSFR
jgi:hypothetical protein